MGTNYLAPTWRQPENINKDKLSNYSIDFGGLTNEDIQLGTTTFLLPGQPSSVNTSVSNPKFSASIFFNFKSTVEGIAVWAIGAGQGGGATYWNLRKNTSDNLEANFRTTSAGYTTITGGTTLTSDTWYHACVTWDGDNINLYLNGVSDAAQVAATTFYYSSTPAYSTIGSFRYSASATGNEWEGKLSQATVFDYALSADQTTYLYNLNNPMAISGAEPIAYYPIGDNSNPTALAGYPNVVSDADSVFDFAASNEEIDAPSPYADGTQGDLTISAWVKQDSITTSYRPFICTGFTSSMTQPQIAMALRNVGGNRLYLFYNGGGGSNYIYAENVMTEANRWYHCAFVRSGSTGKLYVDGQEVSTSNSADFSIDPQVTTSDSEITLGGWRYSGSNESLNGELSNVCLWKTALTDGIGGQIEELYNNGLPLLELSEIPQDNNLLGWYKLNQSAILTPGNPTNWTITKIGNPNYSQSSDGCFNVTAAGALQWHDNNYNQLSSGNYFQWNSPAIYTSGSNIVLSSTGGSHFNPFYANEISLEYSIDGGSFVVWHTQVIPTAYGVAFTVPSTGNLTVSNNIRIRVKGLDRGSTGSGNSYLRLLDVSVTGGTTSYTESFGGTQYGWYGGAENQPPATSSADHWDIPDNRSAFPQSFSFDGVDDQIDLGLESGLSLGGASKYSTSLWFKKGSNSTNCLWGYNYGDSNGSGLYLWQTSGNLRLAVGNDSLAGSGGYGYYNIASANIPIGEWTNIVVVFDGTLASGNDRIKVYQNGEVAIGTYTNGSNFPATLPTGNGASNRNVYLGQLQLGGGSFSYSFDGEMSNVMQWDTDLSLANANTIYNNGVPLPTASVKPSNLKLWTRLDNSSKWNTITSQWNIPINSITPTPYSKSALSKSVFNTFIENSSTSGIDLTSPTTTSFWLKSKTTQSNFAINAGSLGGGNDLAVIGERILVYRGSNNYRYFNVNTTIINDNNWHNLILYTPGYANADIASTRLFMDGIELDVYSTISSGTPGTPSNNPILGVGNVYLDITEASFSNAVIWSSDQTANVTEIYNNGTPASSYTGSPILWWELNNLTSGLDDLSGNGNNAIPSGPVFVVVEEDIIAYQLGVSDGMTEANLIDDNVSTVNGESDTLPGTALVQSDLTRKLPFSNYSIDYNGTDDKITLASSISTGNNYTVSLWLNPENVSSGNSYLFSDSTTSPFKGLALDQGSSTAGGFGNFYYYTGAVNIVNNTAILGDVWSHIVISFNITGQEIKFYVNGVLDKTTTSVANIGTSINEFATRSAGNYFNGKLSNISIFNSLLTQEEVLDVYNNGVPTNLNTSFTPGPPNYWWPMDEDHTYFNGSVLVVRDAISSNDGTGSNVVQENIVGNAPGSKANGVGSNLTIADLKGDMKNSINNSYSINMADYADGVTNPADSGRSTNVP